MNNTMKFPKTFDKFVEEYGFVDSKEIYTNGSRLITEFRVKQWLEHLIPELEKWDELNIVLESVYKCPACVLDKDEALDKIMNAYKKIR